MAHSILDQLEYESLTGNILDEAEVDRYHAITSVAVARLEQLLGWPLLPDSWENMYLEIGKSKSNLSCPDADAELDPPDAVIGSYRLFTLQPNDPWLAIDPALEVHAVKYIRGNVTCKEYETDEYIPKYMNSNPSTIKFIGIRKFMCDCVNIREPREFAVDADWAYAEDDDGNSTLPTDLKKILADMVAEELNPKKDVKSESVVSHSYTKFDQIPVAESSLITIRRYAGPNGTANRRLV